MSENEVGDMDSGPQGASVCDDYRLYGSNECGEDGYPAEWHERLKHEVREVAGHHCVRCGHPYRSGEHGKGEWTRCDERCTHGGPLRSRPSVFHAWVAWVGDERPPFAGSAQVEAQWRILTVHHLDGDKANCRWWNLAALCQRCHLEIQGKVVMERRWCYEHSDWFKPYVAGYYALHYLGEEIDREEAEQRMDKLLALEHRQQDLFPQAQPPERGGANSPEPVPEPLPRHIGEEGGVGG